MGKKRVRISKILYDGRATLAGEAERAQGDERPAATRRLRIWDRMIEQHEAGRRGR